MFPSAPFYPHKGAASNVLHAPHLVQVWFGIILFRLFEIPKCDLNPCEIFILLCGSGTCPAISNRFTVSRIWCSSLECSQIAHCSSNSCLHGSIGKRKSMLLGTTQPRGCISFSWISLGCQQCTRIPPVNVVNP